MATAERTEWEAGKGRRDVISNSGIGGKKNNATESKAMNINSTDNMPPALLVIHLLSIGFSVAYSPININSSLHFYFLLV